MLTIDKPNATQSPPASVAAPIAQPPKLLDRLRAAIRVRHYSLATERTYIGWVKRFIYFHQKRHPQDMGAAEVEAFLSALATELNVSASTQNQAMHAILFLYRDVLGVTLPWLDGITRAKINKRLPVVLTVAETQALLRRLPQDTNGLIVRLLYGTGMRIKECLRLRIKDVDLARGEIIVREGKDRACLAALGFPVNCGVYCGVTPCAAPALHTPAGAGSDSARAHLAAGAASGLRSAAGRSFHRGVDVPVAGVEAGALFVGSGSFPCKKFCIRSEKLGPGSTLAVSAGGFGQVLGPIWTVPQAVKSEVKIAADSGYFCSVSAGDGIGGLLLALLGGARGGFGVGAGFLDLCGPFGVGDVGRLGPGPGIGHGQEQHRGKDHVGAGNHASACPSCSGSLATMGGFVLGQ